MNILNFIGIFVNSIATMISGIVTVYKLNTLHYYGTATHFWQSVYRLAAILLHFKKIFLYWIKESCHFLHNPALMRESLIKATCL